MSYSEEEEKTSGLFFFFLVKKRTRKGGVEAPSELNPKGRSNSVQEGEVWDLED